jgi:kynureninase
MTQELSPDHAQRLDASDPLRHFRERFALPCDERGQPLVYLCGHSLGLQPLAARDAVLKELDDWASLGVRGHEHARNPWIHYHELLSPGLARLTGAEPGEVVAMSSLTVNLHLMLASFYRPRGERHRILIEAGAFPSDRHAVVSHLEWHGHDPSRALIELAPPQGSDLVAEDAIEDCLERHGSDVALVLWPGVQFRTGQSFDVGRITRAAQRAGCVAGFDLAHSIGNTPLDLHASGADFAVWCSYKYLNGGPGAIGGCFVHERHTGPAPRGRLAGWWGHELASRFEMLPGFRAAAGAAGWQVSNPPILSAAPLLSSLSLFDEAGPARLREKSVALTGFLEQVVERVAGDVRIISPRDPGSRGCQLSLRIPSGRGRRVFDWLAAHGAVCDWRSPDVIRIAPAPLYNRYEDALRFGELLAQALRAA